MKIPRKSIYILGVLLFLSLAIRSYVAFNAEMHPDELVYNVRAINMLEARRINTIDQAPIYFYLVDILFKIFGITNFASRLLSVLSGTLLVLIIYFIIKEIFENESAAIFSAFFVAIGSYYNLNLIEMDQVAGFFSILSFLFFIKAIKYEKLNLYLISAIFSAIGILNKSTMLVTLPAFLFYGIFNLHKPLFVKKMALSKRRIKHLAVFFILMGILLLPIIIANYLLYQDKGYGDILFTRFLSKDKGPYAGLSGIDNSWSFSYFSKKIIEFPALLFTMDFFTLLFFIIWLIFFKKNFNHYALLIWGLLPLLFLLGTSAMDVHLAPFTIIFSIFAGLMLEKICQNLKNSYVLLIVLTIALSFIYLTFLNLGERSSVLKLRDFALETEKDSFVIADSALYRGRIAWAFNDRNYLESANFYQIHQASKNEEFEKRIVYFVECAAESCGWAEDATSQIKEVNKPFIDYILKNSPKITHIKQGEKLIYIVYRAEIPLPSGIGKFADAGKSFYFYPVGWKQTEDLVDGYSIDNFFEKIIETFARILLYVEIFVAIIGLFVPLFLWYEEF